MGSFASRTGEDRRAIANTSLFICAYVRPMQVARRRGNCSLLHSFWPPFRATIDLLKAHPMKRCPLCNSEELHRSRRIGVIERTILTMLFLMPFRCEDCSARFLLWSFAARP